MIPTLYTAEVFKMYEEAPNTKSYYFAKPRNFFYKAGQYIRLLVSDDRGTRFSRYFTLSSNPLDDFLRITVKIHDTPFKKVFDQIKEGHAFSFYGPIGNFTLDHTAWGDIVCLSMGIGITPFISMMWYAYEQRVPVNIRLLALFKSKEDFLFKYSQDKLEIGSMVRRYPLRTMYWSMQQKRFSFATLQEKIPDWETVTYFLCGSDQFVRGYKVQLREARIPAKRIHHELFI